MAAKKKKAAKQAPKKVAKKPAPKKVAPKKAVPKKPAAKVAKAVKRAVKAAPKKPVKAAKPAKAAPKAPAPKAAKAAPKPAPKEAEVAPKAAEAAPAEAVAAAPEKKLTKKQGLLAKAAQTAKAAVSAVIAAATAAHEKADAPPAPMPTTPDGGTHHDERVPEPAAPKPSELTLKAGDTAPDFTLPADDDQPVSLKDLRGKKVVLYFYPRDNTPGCTLEGKEFSSLQPEFEAKNAIILGVSTDNTASHRKFKNTCELSVKLLADEGAEISRKYGVFREKNMYGRITLGIARTTFLIDEKGRIERVWERVKVDDHALNVLGAIA